MNRIGQWIHRIQTTRDPGDTIALMSRCPSPNPIASVDAIHTIPTDRESDREPGIGVLAGLGNNPHAGPIEITGTWVIEHDDPDPIGRIDQLVDASRPAHPSTTSGWLMLLGYELGGAIEPKALRDSKNKPTHLDTSKDFPLVVLQRWRAKTPEKFNTQSNSGEYEIGSIRSSMGREAYIQAVERAQRFIGAGDIYQANIAHHLVGSFSGRAIRVFDDLIQCADPKFGAMMIFEHRGVRHAVGSISPELFLSYDSATNQIATEPMKGTRPGGGDHAELRDSVKDRAELDMITDLMRNDLGRICTLGSVRVKDPRSIESHQSGVIQASSRIEGQLRSGVGLGEIIRAAFPPGSVTGAPKVRAMQIINELERCPRGPYCGSMLLLDDSGAIRASVLIRTTHIWGEIDPEVSDGIINGRFSYPAGAGVVADSNSEAEWAETLVKAAILEKALGIDLDAVG